LQHYNKLSPKKIPFVDKLPSIIKGCKKQDPIAQKALYELFAAKMFGICLRYCNNETDAQDVLQEGFVKIFSKVEQYSNKGAFEGWMRRVIVNTALAKYRSQHKHVFADDNMAKYENEQQTDDVNESLTQQELMKLIQELSPKYRVVFNLYAIEGYSHKEIAKMLNISEGTSKSNLSRARNILQEKVAGYYESAKTAI
jgi:RNA polymerase sigma factor (sigma-70 family)